MSKNQPYCQGRAESKRDVQRILDNQGKNFMDVAVLAGVSKQTVSATMNGFRHKALAKADLLDQYLIWQSKFGASVGYARYW